MTQGHDHHLPHQQRADRFGLAMPRTATVTLPYMTALASANSAPIRNASAPGLVTMMTPENRSAVRTSVRDPPVP